MTIHLSSLDEEQHLHGPFSPQANADLEVIDGQLAQLFAASRANDPKAIALVVSDHGFVQITHKVNLMQPFLHAGLLQSGGAWKAQPWSGGGMAAVMLHDPADLQTQAQVRDLLQAMKADPNNGIAEVLERDAIKQRGAFPDASFLIVMKLGYYALADSDEPAVERRSGHCGQPWILAGLSRDARGFFHRRSGHCPWAQFGSDRHAADRADGRAAARRPLARGDPTAARGPSMTIQGNFGYHSGFSRGNSS